MLKKLTTLPLLLMCALAYSQKSEVITDSLKTKAQLFAKSLEWVTKTWKSANDVVQMKDQESGTIIVKGGIRTRPKSLGIPADGVSMTDVTIRVKDGKSKIEFGETTFKYKIGTVWNTADANNGPKRKWKADVEKEEDEMIADYKGFVSQVVDDF